jgi:ribonuclease T2
MRQRRAFLLVVLGSILVFTPAEARRKHRNTDSYPGHFDYYVLSLSWSPQYCTGKADHRDDPQCDRKKRYGFVVHGLWPQNARGYPSECSTTYRVDAAVVDSMLDIMPSDDLIRHEWSKHGTCSGLDPETYFGRVRSAFSSIEIPTQYRRPDAAFEVPASELIRQFHEVNPAVDATNLVVSCRSRYLTELRICMDKELRIDRCGSDIKSKCGPGALIVRPVR